MTSCPVQRVLVAPDKFKGTASAEEAARAIAVGVRRALPHALVRLLPIADGGEGSLDALLSAGAIEQTERVLDAFGSPVLARWAVMNGVAVVEAAEVVGLTRSSSVDPRSAIEASSWGVGALLSAVLRAGFDEVLLFVGGVSTSDGGLGAITALAGLDFDEQWPPGAPPVSTLLSRAARRLAQTRIRIATDVTAPLTGPLGAARQFAPQKGADGPTVEVIERRLGDLADAVAVAVGRDDRSKPGTGAAGGLPLPLVALGAEIVSGFAVLSELHGLETSLSWADLVITGEGSLDRQSLGGKGPVALARRSARCGTPAAAVVGRSTLTRDEIAEAGFVSVRTLVEFAPSVDHAKGEAARYLAVAAEVCAREFARGSGGPAGLHRFAQVDGTW